MQRLRQHTESVNRSAHAEPGGSDLLLVNPSAGGGRAARALPALKQFAQDQNWPVEFCVTQNAADLATKARCAAGEGYRRLLVLGGDGTFQILLNAVRDYPDSVLGVIPAGGGNDLASSLHLPPDPRRAAALLLKGETQRMDAVKVRTATGDERLYVGGGGVGLDAEAARFASGSFRNLPGRSRYLLSAIRALFSFHSINVQMTLQPGDSSIECAALLVAVLNTPSYGAGLYLAPDAQVDDGLLDLVVVENLKFLQVLPLLPSLWSRGQLHTAKVRRFRATCVRIQTETPCRFHGDGEILGNTPVEVSVVPRAFSIVRPADKAGS